MRGTFTFEASIQVYHAGQQIKPVRSLLLFIRQAFGYGDKQGAANHMADHMIYARWHQLYAHTSFNTLSLSCVYISQKSRISVGSSFRRIYVLVYAITYTRITRRICEFPNLHWRVIVQTCNAMQCSALLRYTYAVQRTAAIYAWSYDFASTQ